VGYFVFCFENLILLFGKTLVKKVETDLISQKMEFVFVLDWLKSKWL
tara:strand:- start:1268 stop:1408 length:141 start_codon:yes stop_codon:yes gene_type:complete